MIQGKNEKANEFIYYRRSFLKEMKKYILILGVVFVSWVVVWFGFQFRHDVLRMGAYGLPEYMWRIVWKVGFVLHLIISLALVGMRFSVVRKLILGGILFIMGYWVCCIVLIIASGMMMCGGG